MVQQLNCHSFVNNTKFSILFVIINRSTDGLSILTNSEDQRLRIFNIETDESNQCKKFHKVNEIKEGGTIYDYVWYPNTVQNRKDVKLLVNVYKLKY